MPKPKAANGQITIKIPRSIYEKIRSALDHVRKHGWVSIRAKRNDAPTIGSVVEEAISRLAR